MNSLQTVLNYVATPTRGKTPSPSADPVEKSPKPRGDRRRKSSPRASSARHSVRDEEPPEDRFYHPEFQRAFGDARVLMARLAGVLGSSDLHLEPDSTIRALRQRAGKLANFQCPSSRVVGLVGDTGVGKSSLINSLLDFKGLARASSSGKACTCVVTEYAYHDSQDFNIEVHLFDDDELRDQFTELVPAYRYFRQNPPESYTDANERRYCEEKYNLARDTFHTMFPHQFKTVEQLLVAPNLAEIRITERLVAMARELGPSPSHPQVRTSLEDCAALLLSLTSEGPGQGPAIWPFIKKISVFLNSYILSKGLILVDLPGLRDLNSARRNVTERYLLECNEIFAVCPIDRATDDAGVAAVFGLARKARLSNVGIVCTKSDVVKSEEAKNDHEGPKRAEIRDRIDSLATVERELAEIKNELADLPSDQDDDSDGERAERIELSLRKDRKYTLIEKREFELKECIVTARNQFVAGKLKTLYRKGAPTGEVRVFCAGNVDYWANRDEPKTRALKFLKLSGIIEIRRYCISLVSESQLRAAQKYIQDEIPDLISQVDLWLQSGAGSASAEKKQFVRNTLDGLEARLQRGLSGRKSIPHNLERSLVLEFGQKITSQAECRIGVWTKGAAGAAREWETWAHTTYAAFCRNYGEHHTQKAGPRCWNEEAMKVMIHELEEPWNEFLLAVGHHMKTLKQAIEDSFDDAIINLDDALENKLDCLLPLLQRLGSQQRLLVGEVDAAGDKYETELRTLRTNSLSHFRTSYFGQSMEDSYRRCNLDSGVGSWGRRKTIIGRTLGSERLFRKLVTRFKVQLQSLTSELHTEIMAAMEAHLGDIKKSLDLVRDENIALESEKDPAFGKRLAEETGQVKEAMKRVKEAMEREEAATTRGG
ncbi:hypothetical protein B0H67DRAFT_647946 [Lasiosphaeris hirsuta]|uniref:Nuclear GTPase SLIP-GC n=1 Tax=Lasiosphaeris hirsuta TaxID=260670 RepID=A0AA40A213_9PEZI|nr:hypothetical protein B0H67DRAFT_647946 [Lasiosphaeris hirsuta]